MRRMIQLLFTTGFILAEIAIWTMNDKFSVKCASSALHCVVSAGILLVIYDFSRMEKLS